MKGDQELRFVCKLCDKKYPCGKSLGGHMRSHVIANSAESEEKVQSSMKMISSLDVPAKNIIINETMVDENGNAQSSYGLRENPKKTWRAVDSRFSLPQEKFCKQCGKGFQSVKALCGHMACHSDKERGLKDDHSWTSENQKVVTDCDSDGEPEEGRRKTTRSSKCKRYQRIGVKSSSFYLANDFSSFGSEIEEQEQEDLAMCLMMLSEDSGKRGGMNSIVESSDNNSVVLETKSSLFDVRTEREHGPSFVLNGDESPNLKKIEMKSKNVALDDDITEMENSDSGYFLAECTKSESDVSSGECKKPKMDVNQVKSYITEPIRDCTKENGSDDADKNLNSHSHRAGSQKKKFTSESHELSNESFRKEKGSSDAKTCNDIQKRSKYECLNCKRTFNSYQALGGHRPCHRTSLTHLESRSENSENTSDDPTIDKLWKSSSINKKQTIKSSSQHAEKQIKPTGSKSHVCPFCQRVFKNGHALGGHKRSHFIKGHKENSRKTPINKAELPDLLDLNVPAPAGDKDYGHGQMFV